MEGTIFLLNSGAHWTHTEFHVSSEQVFAIYQAAASLAIKRLSELPESDRNVVLFRPTVPGHENCWEFSHPMGLTEAHERFVTQATKYK
jgi:hypothetical protein